MVNHYIDDTSELRSTGRMVRLTSEARKGLDETLYGQEYEILCVLEVTQPEGLQYSNLYDRINSERGVRLMKSMGRDDFDKRLKQLGNRGFVFKETGRYGKYRIVDKGIDALKRGFIISRIEPPSDLRSAETHRLGVIISHGLVLLDYPQTTLDILLTTNPHYEVLQDGRLVAEDFSDSIYDVDDQFVTFRIPLYVLQREGGGKLVASWKTEFLEGNRPVCTVCKKLILIANPPYNVCLSCEQEGKKLEESETEEST